MNQITRYIMTLVALVALTMGAWATDKYNVTFKANGNSKVVEGVTLPWEVKCNAYYRSGELDLIIKGLYGLSQGYCYNESPTSDNANVACGIQGDNQFITISAPFDGTATVTGKYYDNNDDIFDYSLEITCAQADEITVTPVEGKTNEWTFQMPASDVEVEAKYYTILREDFETDYSPLSNHNIDLWIERTLQPGSYNSFALPFAMTLDAFKAKIGDNDVKVKELTDASVSGKTLTLTFSDATEIEACKPYLVKFSGAGSVTLGAFDNASMSAVDPQTISKGDVIDFVATLGLKNLTESKASILFIGVNNTLYHPSDDGQKMKGFRAYFVLKGEALNAQSFSIDLGEATGIEVVNVDDNANPNVPVPVNICGQRVGGGYKGIVIMNGKKVIK